VKHFTTPDFWRLYRALPTDIRKLADKNYRLLLDDSRHPSLQFKPIEEHVWAVRVGLHYRALAFREEDGYYWFWIGSHSQYDRLMP
jgi:hypothetical protein